MATAAICAVMVFARPASAQSPTSGNVVAGAASISQAGAVTNINQSSQKAIINWQGFSVGAQNTVNFNQPSSSAATLNRVIGNEQSVINGAINANGQVFIVNSNGVLFGQGAQVNVGGLVASTLDISNNDFMAGNYKFSGTSNASVVNQGRIRAHGGGYVALLGKTVSNEGMIAAKLGTVAMAAGDKITLNFGGDSLLDVTIDKGTLNALVQNKRAIIANGGQVIMTAKAADQVLSAQVNNSGIIQARTMAALKGGSNGGTVKLGKIKLLAQGGTAKVSGKLDASAPKGGDGGFIETSGDHVKIADDAVITTKAASGNSGAWLIDPTDFSIVTGSSAQTDSGIGVATLLSNLANGDVTIVTSSAGTGAGDININAALNWSATSATPSTHSLILAAANNINVDAPVTWSAGTLTLNAGANVYVNAVMTATGTANFAANYGHVINSNGSVSATVTGTGVNADEVTPCGLYTLQGVASSGAFAGRIDFSGTGMVTLNGTQYTVISSATGLPSVTMSGNYVIGANFSVSTLTSLGTAADPFVGVFNGLGHTITVNTQTTGTGFFDTIGTTGVVSNLTVNGLVKTAANNLGANTTDPTANLTALGLFADINRGSIFNSFAAGPSGTGTVQVQSNASVTDVGGFVGENFGLIANSYTLGGVGVGGTTANLGASATNVGGFVGFNETDGSIYTSAVRLNDRGFPGSVWVGGGPTTSIAYAGGFAGENAGLISQSYNRAGVGIVQPGDSTPQSTIMIAAGFVGNNTSTGTIDQSYVSFGQVTSAQEVGGTHTAGFVGDNAGTITNSYTLAPQQALVSSQDIVGQPHWDSGFAYSNSGTISTSYAETNSNIPYGFVAINNSGTTTNDYYVVRGDTAVSAGPAGVTATQVTTLAANNITSFVGFDLAIWGGASRTTLLNGVSNLKDDGTLIVNDTPILRQLPVLVGPTSSVASYGTAASTFLTSNYFTVVGAQGIDSTVYSFYNSDNSVQYYTGTPLNQFGLTGYPDAGIHLVSDALISSLYTNVQGIFTINPKTLTLASGVVSNKTYDGTTAATVNNGLANDGLVGLVGDQTLDVTYQSAVFNNRNAGSQTADVVYTASDGTNGGKLTNYTIATTATATIAPKTLSAGFTALDKTYDGSVNATVATTQLPGVIGSDNVVLNYTSAQFNDANAAVGKTVALAGLTLTGVDSSNYALQATSIQSSATISPRPLDLYGTEVAANNTSFAAGNLFVKNMVVGDQVALSGTVTLAGTAAGIQPIVNFSSATVNNPNYTLIGATGSVVVGNVSLAVDHVPNGTNITSFGTTTVVTQTLPNTIIDWLRFNIASNETVDFIQPSSTSVILNRVTGNEQSVIAGALNATGRVFIVNPNGILFSSTSQVNVGALVASTLNISDNDFANGNYSFAALDGMGSVTARGAITAASGEFIILAGNGGVTNSGSLKAPGGSAVLAGVNNLTLAMNTAEPGLTSYTLADVTGTTTVSGNVNVASATTGGNGGIFETAGEVIAVNNGFLLDTGISGTWSYSQNADIVIGWGQTFTADLVQNNLAVRDLKLTSYKGNVLLNDAMSWSSDNDLMLTGNNVTINNTVAWSAGTLTLKPGTASGFINLNAVMTASGTASLVMSYNTGMNTSTEIATKNSGATPDTRPTETYGTLYGGINPLFDPASGTFIGRVDFVNNTAIHPLNINSHDYVLITSMQQLDMLDGFASTAATGKPTVAPAAVTNYYALASDIEACGVSSTCATQVIYTSSPIATLTGTLEGLGHTINNMTIVPVKAADGTIGLIGTLGTSAGGLSSGTVRDIGIVRVEIDGSMVNPDIGAGTVGPLVALNYGSIVNAFATGNPDAKVPAGSAFDGTLVPETNSVKITAALSGGNSVGGLVGNNTGLIVNSHSDVSVYSRTGSTGGLVGSNTRAVNRQTGIILNSYATGTVSGGQYSTGGYLGSNYYGGFVGYNNGGIISNSYASGDIWTANSGTVGGFAGYNASVGGVAALNHVFSSGTVTVNWMALAGSGQNAGGLVGRNNATIVDGNTTSKVIVNTDTPDLTFPYFNNIGTLVGYQDFNGSVDTNSHAYGTSTENVHGAVWPGRGPGQLVGIDWPGNTQSLSDNFLPGGTPPSTVQSTMQAAQQAAVQQAVDARTTGSAPTVVGGGTNTNTGAPAATAEGATAEGATAGGATAGGAAAQQALVQQAGSIANAITSNVQNSSLTPPDPALANAGAAAAQSVKSAAVEESVKLVDDAVKADDDRRKRERERRRTAQTSHHRGHTGGGNGGGLGATIRSIDVNGQRFNLQDGAPKQDAPAQAPQ
ncbi:filamentous hemagglutinin N-terminal domain-containing protein [Nitrobacter hamburgensis]|uniref:two-partner secretion domain-containing protein n=1 Tax=Nitrobacter hamburgensis TaxID=912 RepID=UPI0003036156|nr:filamentous hemagglutinin N-terminal domain-containing protein [Nitrobacter hamburgensis]